MVYSAFHDGSADTYLFYFRSYLAPAFYHFFSPMKRSVRPLFTILVLAVFSSTLLCRSALRRGFHAYPSPHFNSTFLSYASIDIGEAKAKQHIEQLLQGNFTSIGWLSTVRRRPETRSPSPSPFTGAPLIFRSHKAYPYWLEFRRLLQEWSRKKSFQREIMLDLVKQPLHRYASCAVVGNSGILINSSHGTSIDAHEAVIRLNNARVHPFERDVGSKTTISFVNSNILHLCARRHGCFCHPYGSNVPLLMYICQPIHFLDLALCNSTAKGPLLTTDPRFDVLCARIVKYYSAKRFVEETGRPLEEWASTHEGSLFHYSSGMQAVMLAVGICEKVSIFGFGKSASAKHHYHTNQKAELSLHDYEAEYDFYRDLVDSPQAIPFISDKFRFPHVQIHQ